MKVTVTEGRYRSGRQHWLVRTYFPGRESERRFFSDPAKLAEFRARREAESIESAQIPEKLKLEAGEYARLLKPHGWDLRRAFEHVMKHVIPFETKPPVAAAVNEFLAAESRLGHAPSTMASLKTHLGRFKARFGDRHLHELGAGDIETWRDELQNEGYEAISVRHFLASVSGCITWAVGRKYCEFNPVQFVDRPAYRPPRPAIFKLPVVEKLFGIAPRHGLLAWSVLGTLCGVRPSELAVFDVAGINLDDRVIVVDEPDSRGALRTAPVMIHPNHPPLPGPVGLGRDSPPRDGGIQVGTGESGVPAMGDVRNVAGALPFPDHALRAVHVRGGLFGGEHVALGCLHRRGRRLAPARLARPGGAAMGRRLIPGRDDERWGLGWAGTHISRDLRRDLSLLTIDLNEFEHGFEAFYNFAVTPATHVTANVQVINSVNPAVDTAVVVGGRFQFDL